MKMLSALTLALVLALPTSAYALDAKVKAGAAGSAATDSMSTETDATATGSVSADAYGTLMSTLNAGKGMADLSAVTEETSISVVNVSSLKANGNTSALDNALDKNAEAKASLQADITANTALSARLQQQGVMIETIVAVTTATDGSLTVYVDDRA